MQINLDLPTEFFLPETRAGFYVDEKRKKIWAVELDLIKKFSDVCEKYNLSYFMDGGTLLGAVRHQGFIPWDDDVDVNMPRKDYDRLIQIASSEFQYPYFLQTSLSMKGFFRTHAQLRNSTTTGCILIDAKKPQINKGIWLDIFVFDNVTDNFLVKKFHKRRIQFVKNLLRMKYDVDKNNINSFSRKLIYKYASHYYKKHTFEELFTYFDQKVLAAYSGKPTKYMGNLTLKWKENWIWPSSYFQGYCYLPFENLLLRAPLFYRDVLAHQYGDYMRIPDIKKEGNKTTHGVTIMDPDTPYEEFDFSNVLKLPE